MKILNLTRNKINLDCVYSPSKEENDFIHYLCSRDDQDKSADILASWLMQSFNLVNSNPPAVILRPFTGVNPILSKAIGLVVSTTRTQLLLVVD